MLSGSLLAKNHSDRFFISLLMTIVNLDESLSEKNTFVSSANKIISAMLEEVAISLI
jgi:hypothetical protein